MAYAYTIDAAVPAGTGLVSDGAEVIREFKSAVLERILTIISTGGINTDPWVLTPRSNFSPGTHNTYDLGVTGTRWRNLFLAGTMAIAGLATFAVGLTVTASGLTVSSGTTAVQALTTTGITSSGTIETTGTAGLILAGTISSSAGGNFALNIMNSKQTAAEYIGFTVRNTMADNAASAGITFVDAAGTWTLRAERDTSRFALRYGSTEIWRINPSLNTNTYSGFASFATGLIVLANGFTVSGNSSITGTLGVSSTLTVTSGGFTVSSGTSALQAITGTTLNLSSTLTVSGDSLFGSATHPVNINRASDATTYGQISFNGVTTFGGALGISARAADKHLYLNALTAGAVFFNVQGTNQGAFNVGGLIIYGASAAAAQDTNDFQFGGTVQTTIGAAGAASALPGAPLGYWIGYRGAQKIVIPYWAAS